MTSAQKLLGDIMLLTALGTEVNEVDIIGLREAASAQAKALLERKFFELLDEPGGNYGEAEDHIELKEDLKNSSYVGYVLQEVIVGRITLKYLEELHVLTMRTLNAN